MFWKARCKKAASFLDSYNWQNRRHEEENRQYDVRLVTETVAQLLRIPVSFSCTPQETSFYMVELMTKFTYEQSQDVLFPPWLRRTREEQLAFLEQDYGKFYEAVYKFDSDEQRWWLRMVTELLIFREETEKPFPYLRFFDSLKGYLQCADSVKKDEMRLFLEKSLSALWGMYLERQEDISKNQDNKPEGKTAYGFMALPLHRRSRKQKEKEKIDKKRDKINKIYVQSA